MATTKRFKITKKDFLNYIMSDNDDVIYWGNLFISEMKKEGMIKETVGKIFDRRDSLPAYLFEDQLTEEEFQELEYGEISISEILLTNTL